MSTEFTDTNLSHLDWTNGADPLQSTGDSTLDQLTDGIQILRSRDYEENGASTA
jgi:hypothetical protein